MNENAVEFIKLKKLHTSILTIIIYRFTRNLMNFLIGLVSCLKDIFYTIDYCYKSCIKTYCLNEDHECHSSQFHPYISLVIYHDFHYFYMHIKMIDEWASNYRLSFDWHAIGNAFRSWRIDYLLYFAYTNNHWSIWNWKVHHWIDLRNITIKMSYILEIVSNEQRKAFFTLNENYSCMRVLTLLIHWNK